ncbi:MAG: branched-chain amino acid aminotransferase [bacterium]|nr:branched-chain amino acid aminotransferase [bacterium]
MEIKRTLLPVDQLKPSIEDPLSIQFGRHFTDYMFTLSYDEGQGWHSPEIKPFQTLPMSPAAAVFHYGQEIFEGQKAYKSQENEILLFRPEENARRFNRSMERMAMPDIPVEDYLYYESELLKLEERWIPSIKGAALYIRPTAIATEPALGVRTSSQYLFFIITCPVGPYYSTGFNPVSLWVSGEYTRAGDGGTGTAKCGGNYGGSMAAARDAARLGYSQVLWLDAKEHRYIEEVGAMNILFVKGDKLVTPPLGGTILPGVTRMSLLQMAPDLGLEVEERRVTIDELVDGIISGSVTEVFGAGTAAVISPVGKLAYKGQEYVIGDNQTGYWAQRFFDVLTGIQYGELEDKYNWVYVVK